jgi:hypothetical protein
MKEHRVMSYAAHGRRFARVPGDEKLLISKVSGGDDTNANQDPDPEVEDEQLEDQTDLEADDQGIHGAND